MDMECEAMTVLKWLDHVWLVEWGTGFLRIQSEAKTSSHIIFTREKPVTGVSTLESHLRSCRTAESREAKLRRRTSLWSFMVFQIISLKYHVIPLFVGHICGLSKDVGDMFRCALVTRPLDFWFRVQPKSCQFTHKHSSIAHGTGHNVRGRTPSRTWFSQLGSKNWKGYWHQKATGATLTSCGTLKREDKTLNITLLEVCTSHFVNVRWHWSSPPTLRRSNGGESRELHSQNF